VAAVALETLGAAVSCLVEVGKSVVDASGTPGFAPPRAVHAEEVSTQTFAAAVQ